MKILKKLDIKEELHYQIFTLLNEMSEWGLTPSDIKILAELYNLDFNLANSGIQPQQSRMTILFSSDTKKSIMDKFNISYNTFNNSLTKLRKKGFITKNTIDEKRLYNLNRGRFNFTIEFLNEEEYQAYTKGKGTQ
jgi:predicted transcriptional regulator